MVRIGLGPNQKCSMGFKFHSAHKVFVGMPERKFLSNFGKSFGGSHLYIHRDRMVVVGFNLVKNCKMAKGR
jgi:hypothetical protein